MFGQGVTKVNRKPRNAKIFISVGAVALRYWFQRGRSRGWDRVCSAGASAQQPQMTAGPDGTLYLVYGAGRTIYCVVSSDGGKSFGPPAALEAGGQLMLGRHRGPRVAATKDAVTITAIAGKRGGGQDGDLLAWRSTDHGKTWGTADGSERCNGCSQRRSTRLGCWTGQCAVRCLARSS